MTQTAPTVEDVARAFVEELARGRWDHPRTAFDAAMAAAMPAAKLQGLWGVLEADGGRFRSIESVRVERKGDLRVALVVCSFERLRKVLRIVVDPDGALAGLFYGPVPEDIEARTRALLAAAAAGDFERASRDFGDVMKKALPPARCAETWRALEEKVGKLQSVGDVQLEPQQGVWASLADARFERERLLVKVVYDARDEVVGLFFLPPRVAWSAPPYADPRAFEEKPVQVGTAPALPGVLTLPRGSGPFPAVVLVHGSGPSDADESVGGVKVFKDLAWGLASRGVAVLRYTKRTLHSPAGVVTQKEEVLDAARDAIALLRRTDGVRPDRVFVVGHSQGGGLAPRIAEGSPGLAGIVVLAGPTRPLQDLLVDQYAYLASLDPGNAALASKIEEARRFKRVVEDPALRPEQELAPPTGGHLTGAYFLDVRGYDPAAVARTLPCRILVLQGERDYQVTAVDFEGWTRALAGKEGASLRTYPSDNHLFVSGSGAPSPLEYERPGHVDEAVVRDIAAWIQGGAPGEGPSRAARFELPPADPE